LLPEDGDAPAGGKALRAGKREDRRLPGAVGSEQRPVLAGSDSERDVVEHLGASREPDIGTGYFENAHAERD
jgi:hypothetical protein